MNTFAPSCAALAAVASQSATCTYGSHIGGVFLSGAWNTPARGLPAACSRTYGFGWPAFITSWV